MKRRFYLEKIAILDIMKSLVEIPEPCNIDWNTMSPLSSDKRYCNSCAKPVVDFSSCSLEEIKRYFSNPENIVHAENIIEGIRNTQMALRKK